MDVAALHYRRGPFFDGADKMSHERLLHDVLDRRPLPSIGGVDPWMPIARFDPTGACVANVDVAVLQMIVDDRIRRVAAIRCVAVASRWRGQGLFRALMREALAWCDEQAPTTILFTEAPSLYAGYGFETVPQHAFVVEAAGSAQAGHFRVLDLNSAADRALVARRIERRSWLSKEVALAIDPATFLRNAIDLDLIIAEVESLNAIVAYEDSDDTLSLYDLVAEPMPHLDQILAALPRAPASVRTMFPPDQLGRRGDPEPEDTGLMVRGARPAAWARPFMVAPTAEF